LRSACTMEPGRCSRKKIFQRGGYASCAVVAAVAVVAAWAGIAPAYVEDRDVDLQLARPNGFMTSFSTRPNKYKLPVTPEDVADAFRVVGIPAAHGMIAASAPVLVALERTQALLLWPLARRLISTSEPAPALAVQMLDKVCSYLKIGFPCPKLFVSPGMRGCRLESMPMGPLRRFAIFVSKGLIRDASTAEFKAMLAREVTLLRYHVLHIPNHAWALVEGAFPKTTAPLERRKLTPLPTAAATRAQRRQAMEQRQREQALIATDVFIRKSCKQMAELCRVHWGLHPLIEFLPNLPSHIRRPVKRLLDKVEPPRLLGHVADVIGSYFQRGGSLALQTFSEKLRLLEEHFQLAHLAHVVQLGVKVAPKGPLPKPREAWRNIRWVYRIGVQRVESMLAFIVRFSQPKSLSIRAIRIRKWRRRLTPSPGFVLALILTTRRTAELEADRAAAEMSGSIGPVVAGLVRLHGDRTERRRLWRGELRGLIEDARAEMPQKYRWVEWWTGIIKYRSRPPLKLRIAELSGWADGRGFTEIEPRDRLRDRELTI